MDGTTRGRVVRWFDHKGFGFVRADNTVRDLFFHHSAVQREPGESLVMLHPDEPVMFTEGTAPDGRSCAVNIVRIGRTA